MDQLHVYWSSRKSSITITWKLKWVGESWAPLRNAKSNNILTRSPMIWAQIKVRSSCGLQQPLSTLAVYYDHLEIF